MKDQEYQYDVSCDPPAPIAEIQLTTELFDILDLPVEENANVDQKMMLDSGAQISVIPSNVVQQIEEILGEKLPYRFRAIEGINGQVYLEREYSLQVLRGKYNCFDDRIKLTFVLGNQALLGRDFINRYSILLDGPNEIWTCG